MENPPVALLLDEDVWPGLADVLHARGVDVLSVHDLGRTGLSDSDQMAFAVAEKRAILTHNVGDFVSLARDYHVARKHHFGVVIAPHLKKGTLIRRTVTLLETITKTDLMNTVRYV